MKLFSLRILLNAAAALSLLVSASSCIKVTPDSGDQAEHYIGFTSSVGTKAPVESSADMEAFAVWAAYYDGGNLQSTPMNNVRVYRSGDLWMYDDLQLWQEGKWRFDAFYPHPSKLAVTDIVKDKDALAVTFSAPKTDDDEQTDLDGLSIDYYYGPTASNDLMVAGDTRNYTMSSPDASPVQFTFEHLLSRVGIAVKSTSNDVRLTSLVFKGMSVLGAYNTPESQEQWRLLTSIPELSNVQPGSFTADLSDISAPLPSDGTAVDVLSDLLLIPQTPGDDANGLGPITITATYSVGGAAPETKELTLPADPAWQPGRHYRYTLTLAGADVTLSVETVPWEKRDFTVIF